MVKYIPPLMKGKKDKEKPAKINDKGQIDFSDNFAMKLHTHDEERLKPITSKKIKSDLKQLLLDRSVTWEVMTAAE